MFSSEPRSRRLLSGCQDKSVNCERDLHVSADSQLEDAASCQADDLGSDFGCTNQYSDWAAQGFTGEQWKWSGQKQTRVS